MSFFEKLRGTAETLFQLGLGGPQLKNNASVFEHRNATDAAFVIARGADPVGVNDFVTKGFAAANGLVQTIFKEITVNTTTASLVFVDLLSQAITTIAGSSVDVIFTTSTTNSNAARGNEFQLVVNGTPKRGLQVRLTNANDGNCGALVYKVTGLAAGAHTIKIQWRATSGTAQIRPVATILEHGSLLLEEVTV